MLETVGITVNKNTIPNETRPAWITSGIRVGTAAATTRGLTNDEFRTVGASIAKAVFNMNDLAKLAEVRADIQAIIDAHPLYPEMEY